MSVPPVRDAGGRRLRSAVIGCLLVGGLVAIWILATPPSAGPDEPSHLIRSASLLRGELGGPASGGNRLVEVPASTGWPPPNCYAFEQFAPASCATSLPSPGDDDVAMLSRAADYPVWGHLLPAVGTLAPATIETYAARVLDALVPVALVGLALTAAARRGWLVGGTALLALTPMAWFVFAVVNPSGIVVAGGLAMWVGVVTASRSPSTLHQWLLAGGFAALALPRRDGFVWAGAIAALALLWSGVGLRESWRALGRGPQLLVAASTIATLAYGAASDARSTKGLLLVPLLPPLAVGARRVWRWASSRGPVALTAVAAGAAAGTAIVIAITMAQRDRGFDREVLRIIVNRTGLRLEEAVGRLGWLDTPIPSTMTLLWFVTLGAVAAVAVLAGDRRSMLLGTSTVLIAIVTSWTLEMAQGDPTGTYYQGRYYLPFLVGVPLAFAATRTPPAGVDRLGRYVGVAALVVVNVGLAAAMRRWGVGNAGPWVPWSWNTYDTVLPPIVLLALHVAMSGGLWWWMDSAVRAESAPAATPRRSAPAVVS